MRRFSTLGSRHQTGKRTDRSTPLDKATLIVERAKILPKTFEQFFWCAMVSHWRGNAIAGICFNC